MDYPSDVIWSSSIKLSGHVADAVAMLKHSTTQTEFCFFSCVHSAFRQFFTYLVHLVPPLNKILANGKPKHLSTVSYKESSAVRSLKDTLRGRTLLAIPNSKWQYTIDTDVFRNQIRYVLFPKTGTRN